MLVTWWSKNKVVVVGAIGAVIMAVSAFSSQETIVWAQVAMAAIVALGAYLGRNLRGQVGSIIGICFAVLISVVPDLFAHKPIDWQHQFLYILGQIGVLYFGITAPPAKSLGYEKTAVIEGAKDQGEQITENMKVVKKDDIK